jgi:hypothetical protein
MERISFYAMASHDSQPCWYTYALNDIRKITSEHRQDNKLTMDLFVVMRDNTRLQFEIATVDFAELTRREIEPLIESQSGWRTRLTWITPKGDTPDPDEPMVEVKASKLMEYGKWDQACEMTGTNPYAVKEGLMNGGDVLRFTMSQYRTLLNS